MVRLAALESGSYAKKIVGFDTNEGCGLEVNACRNDLLVGFGRTITTLISASCDASEIARK